MSAANESQTARATANATRRASRNIQTHAAMAVANATSACGAPHAQPPRTRSRPDPPAAPSTRSRMGQANAIRNCIRDRTFSVNI